MWVILWLEAAWQARGGGFANSVTSEGWKGFSRHLEVASQLFTAAWKLHPEFPEAPEKMIAVAMAGGAGNPKESIRLWFDRAIAAQFDYLPAYNSFRWALRPRWRGSREEMLDFGLACLNSKRFDTEVPGVYQQILNDIDIDNEMDHAIWKQPETYQHLREMYEGYIKASHGDKIAWYRSFYASTAWFCGHYDDARVRLEALGKAVNKEAFQKCFDADLPFARGEVFARTGADREKVERAETARAEKRYAEALAQYTALNQAHANDSLLAPYFTARHEELASLDAFARGEWVELNPAANPVCWRKEYGNWSFAPDGTITGASTPQGLQLICDYDFGDTLEFSGEVEFTKSIWSECNAAVIFDDTGLIANHEKPSGLAAFEVHKFTQEAVLCDNLQGEAYQKYFKLPMVVTSPDRRSFLLQQWHQQITASLDGKRIFNNVAIETIHTTGKRRIGIGCNCLTHYDPPAETITFRHLRVRKLTKKPS